MEDLKSGDWIEVRTDSCGFPTKYDDDLDPKRTYYFEIIDKTVAPGFEFNIDLRKSTPDDHLKQKIWSFKTYDHVTYIKKSSIVRKVINPNKIVKGNWVVLHNGRKLKIERINSFDCFVFYGLENKALFPISLNEIADVFDSEEKLNGESMELKIGDWIEVKCDKNGFPNEYINLNNFTISKFKVIGISPAGYACTVALPASVCGGWPFDGENNIRDYTSYDKTYKGSAYHIHLKNIIAKVPAPNTVAKCKSPKVKKEIKIMSKKSVSALETVKDDSIEAGYRISATQLTKASRAAIVKALNQAGAKKTQIKAITELLDSEAGLASVSILLGWVLTYMPGMKENDKVQRLAKEFRVGGMTIGGNMFAEAVVNTVMPVLAQQLANLPEPPKVRVAETPVAPLEVEEEEMDEPAPKKRRRAA